MMYCKIKNLNIPLIFIQFLKKMVGLIHIMQFHKIMSLESINFEILEIKMDLLIKLVLFLPTNTIQSLF